MKQIYYFLIAIVLLLPSCKDETENVFEKSADQRAAEAVAELKDKLVSPANGWRMQYQPEDQSGAYLVLLHFKDDNKLVIESDLGARDGEFFQDTLTYRIDSSLGLELVFETYSFFSYLFEQDQATFLAEYEFLYINETPDGALVLQSKSDPSDPTVIVLEEAAAGDVSLLARGLSTNINTISDDIGGLLFSSPAYEMTYQNKDLKLYFSINPVRRTIEMTGHSKKSTSTGSQTSSFFSGYYLEGDAMILQEPLNGTFQGLNISIESIRFTNLVEAQADICGGRDVHKYQGLTSQDDQILLEATLASPDGGTFSNYEFLVSPIEYIFNNGESAAEQIASDITGAGSMQLYYDYSGGFYALGFFIQNADGTATFALRQFTPVKTGNRIVFNFADQISIYGNTNTDANVNNINIYLNALTQGGQTYAFEIEPGVYEFHNPCTGWSAAFIGIE